jgi:predicted DNA-binding protein (MmcQ/YjbR family)
VNALERLSEICAELPEAERELSGRHAVFRVRGRTFAYYLDDHRGNEGIVGVVFKAPAGEGLIAAQPDRFYKAAYLHHRGWVGLRLDTDSVDWTEVADFVTDSYLAVAPKRLAAQLEPER